MTGNAHESALVALALFNQKRYAEALPLLEQLVNAGPTDLNCVLAFSACLERTGDEDRAVRILRRVNEAMPVEDSAVRLASALTRMGRNADLDRDLPGLIASFPGSEKLRAIQAEHALTAGDFATGFDLMHHRWAVSLEPPRTRGLACPEWDGRRFEGTLLVTAEQGLGDEIVVSSLYEDLVALGQRSLVECDPRLLPLLRRSFPTLEFTDRHGDALARAVAVPGAITRKVCGMELGRFFRRERAAFPTRRAWLRADPARTAALRRDLQARFPGKTLVGLSWRSHRMLMGDAKSIPLSDLWPVLTRPDTVFVSLQYFDVRADLAELRARTGIEVVTDSGIDPTQDIDGLAALSTALDAIVSCSNTAVHVAGAVGARVYALVPGTRYSFWYWGYDGASTPLYPTLQLFRGPARKSWPELAQDVRHALDRDLRSDTA